MSTANSGFTNLKIRTDRLLNAVAPAGIIGGIVAAASLVPVVVQNIQEAPYIAAAQAALDKNPAPHGTLRNVDWVRVANTLVAQQQLYRAEQAATDKLDREQSALPEVNGYIHVGDANTALGRRSAALNIQLKALDAEATAKLHDIYRRADIIADRNQASIQALWQPVGSWIQKEGRLNNGTLLMASDISTADPIVRSFKVNGKPASLTAYYSTELAPLGTRSFGGPQDIDVTKGFTARDCVRFIVGAATAPLDPHVITTADKTVCAKPYNVTMRPAQVRAIGSAAAKYAAENNAG